MADFFSDSPWGNIPASRLCNMSHVRILPPGRLLGGSSKTTKLAALAAARKKKESEKASGQASSSQIETGRAIELLDKLGNQKVDTPSLADKSNQSRAMLFPSRQKRAASPERSAPVEMKSDVIQAPVAQREDLKARPSIFAQILLGEESQAQGGVLLYGTEPSATVSNCDETQFHLPYMTDPNYIKRDPFTKPSPDDVILRAQGKDLSRD
jgi:elongation factor 1 alpha-like protein